MGADFIRELCTSIAGHWEPDRLFMIFTAYIDESDTHGAKPDVVMSAMLGHGRDWELFGRGLKRLKDAYGFSTFHSVKFRHRKGDFEHWPDERFGAFMADLGNLVGDILMEAMSIRLTHALYKEHFLDVRPRKMPRTSQYGVCFAALLAAMTRRVIQEGKNHRLSVVIEGGHPNAAETAHLFKQYQERLQNDGHDILRTHTLALKADAPLLMIADVIAYSGARDWRAINAGAKPHYSERNMVPPKKDEVGWTVLDVTPETLRDMIQRYNDERAHAHQDYLNRRRDASTSRVSG